MPRRVVLVSLLALSLLLAGCTEDSGSGPADEDGEGLGDATERNGWVITVTRAEGPVTLDVDSDPSVRDTDGDGLEDFDEKARGTDPRDVDSDRDGLLDGFNLTLEPASERARELRGLGILEEPVDSGNFLGELALCRQYSGLKSHVFSSDRPEPDQLGDGEELVGWNVTIRGEALHVTSDPCERDTDSDGLVDHLEKELGAHPRVADTDKDGVPDGQDADPAWDLGLALSNLTVERTNGTGPVRISLGLGVFSGSADAENGAGDAFLVEVSDGSPSRDSLVAIGQLIATDAGSDEGVALFPDGASTITTFDLVARTLVVGGQEHAPGRVTLEGSDGSISFDWRVTRG